MSNRSEQVNNIKVIAIIEARMTSSRLPGKHLLKANGKPMLAHLVDRLKTVSSISEIVIATTTNTTDDVLVHFAEEAQVGVYRGSENDVMGRVLEAGEAFDADVICEVTGDCPIIDPRLVEQVIQTFHKNAKNKVVYVNNGESGIPGGMSTQVFNLSALKQSESMTDAPLDREHVTLHIKRHYDLFPPIYLVAPDSLQWPDLGLTMDEESDYILLKKIVDYFGDEKPYFSCEDVIKLLRKNPDWVAINHDVCRKGAS